MCTKSIHNVLKCTIMGTPVTMAIETDGRTNQKGPRSLKEAHLLPGTIWFDWIIPKYIMVKRLYVIVT